MFLVPKRTTVFTTAPNYVPEQPRLPLSSEPVPPEMDDQRRPEKREDKGGNKLKGGVYFPSLASP